MPTSDSDRVVPNADEMTPWGKTNQELYDEGVAKFEAAKAAGLHPVPFPWLAQGRLPSHLASGTNATRPLESERDLGGDR
jgi:hypothetical protein